LADCTFNQAVELWNLGFSGYYSDMTTTLEKYVSRFGREGIRPDLSVAAFANGEPVGFVLVARRTVDGAELAWNGGTGVSPRYRGKGIAKLLMREAVKTMREGGARKGLLEVVQKNAGAIAVYESAGFRICDALIGAKLVGAVSEAVREASLAGPDYPVGQAKPHQLAKLPFFRHETAWSSAWFNNPDADGLVVFAKDGGAGAYAIVKKRYDGGGKLTGCTLLQCAADPSRPDRRELLRAALAEAFSPLEEHGVRATDNTSMSDPVLTEWLAEAGFDTVYTQFLMKADLSDDLK